jgi:hypothetical protein
MTTHYFAGVDESGLVRKCRRLDDGDPMPPSPYPPTPPEDASGLAWTLLSEPIDWKGPTPTSALYLIDGALAWKETATLDDLKVSKLAELATEFSRRMAAVKAGYPDEEVQSWFEQKAEALAYTADPTAPAPLLTTMASARGITVADLAARVLANAAAWAVTSGAIIGRRQAYEDAVAIATDSEQVRAIVWPA